VPNGTQESSKPIAGSVRTEATEAKVRELPIAAVGIAFGEGVIGGAVGYALLRREPTWRDRIEDADVGRRLSKLLNRFI